VVRTALWIVYTLAQHGGLDQQLRMVDSDVCASE
jgi:hypothetical protein